VKTKTKKYEENKKLREKNCDQRK